MATPARSVASEEGTRPLVQDVLSSLKRLPGVEAAALASRDGILVAGLFPRSLNSAKIASLSAGLVGTADMAAQEMGRLEASHTIVTTVEGDIVARKVGEDYVLTVVLRPDANLGLILLHVGRVTEQLTMLLSTSSRGG